MSGRAPLEVRVLGCLAELAPAVDGFTLESNIFEGGVFDSLALVSLVGWIEEEIGHPIDPAALDLATEWRRVSDIVAFIERERGARPRGG